MDGWDAVWGLGIQIGEPPKKGDLAEDRFIIAMHVSSNYISPNKRAKQNRK